MKQVTVIGAGFSGLSLARALLKRGHSVRVLEKGPRAGGLIDTLETPLGLVEKAAPSITRTDRVDALLAELGVESLVPSKASKKRLFFVGHRTSWPLSLVQSLHLGIHFLISKISGKLTPRAGETLFAWGERCLTRPATELLLATALQGIYAGDARRMSASLVLGPMFRKSRDRFRGVMGIKGGMKALIEAFESDIRKRGGEFHFNETIQELPEGPVVLAVPAPEAAKLLAGKHPENAQLISRIHVAPLLTVTVFVREPTGPKAFGCLVPRGQGLRVLGVLLNHAIFPGRDPGFSETWIFGGATDPEILQLPREELLKLLIKERSRIFAKMDPPLDAVVTAWPEGLPHYDLVLEEVLSSLKDMPQTWLHGNWCGSIGLSRILERADALAEKISKDIQ